MDRGTSYVRSTSFNLRVSYLNFLFITFNSKKVMFLLKNYRYGTGTEAISYLKKKKTMYDPIIPIYSIEDSKKIH